MAGTKTNTKAPASSQATTAVRTFVIAAVGTIFVPITYADSSVILSDDIPPPRPASVRRVDGMPRLNTATARLMTTTTTTKKTRLRSALCVDSMCSMDCVAYRTPLGECYNGATLFPGDPSWGEFDIMDRVDESLLSDGLRPADEDDGDGWWSYEGELVLVPDEEYASYYGAGSFDRFFYSTKNGTCEGQATDSFDDLPLGDCVGPFGAPRPWGVFSFVEVEEEEEEGDGGVGGTLSIEGEDARYQVTGTNGEDSKDRRDERL